MTTCFFRRIVVGSVFVLGAAWLPASTGRLLAQRPSPAIPAQPPGTQPLPGAPRALPVPPPLLLPADRPDQLIAVQQLALAAYPELRTRGLQVRVEAATGTSTITIGFAERDRDTILEASRPRAAMLVIEATFDTQQTLTRALLRGILAHTAERRRVKALTTGVAQTLAAEGAVFGPGDQAALLQQLDLRPVTALVGPLTVQGAQFTQDASDDGVFWTVTATTQAGETVTLGFEPYIGRLVRFARGAAQ